MTENNENDFLDAFEEHWDDYRKQFKAARRDLSEECVHDLRVAARRFEALLGIVRNLDAHPRVKKIRGFLKKQLNQLDELHDAQVMLQETTQGLEDLPQLEPFQQYLQERTTDLESQARKKVRASKPSDLEALVKMIRTVAKRHSDDDKLLDELIETVDEAHARTSEAFGALSPDDPATIHRIRIAFKKFRYMVETIQPLVPDYPEPCLHRMHIYQEAMGKIHDTTLLLGAIKEFDQRSGQEPETTAHARQAEAYYEKRLKALIWAYLERKDEFHMFWRAAPGEPFPWEKDNEPIHRTTRNRRTAGRQQQRTGRQREAADRPGTQEVPADRASVAGDGVTDRRDPDFPVPKGN